MWFSGTKAKTKAWLDQFDWGNAIAVAHNAMFDMAILNWHFDIRPKRIVDTLSMLRAIDGPDAGNSLAKAAERYGLGVKGNEVINALGKMRVDFTPEEMARYAEYCCNDADLTYDLFQRIAVGFPQVEFRLIDLTIRMFTEPMLSLDEEVLTNHLSNVKSSKDALMAKLNYDKADLMSNPKLAELLIEEEKVTLLDLRTSRSRTQAGAEKTGRVALDRKDFETLTFQMMTNIIGTVGLDCAGYDIS